jgi:hypothetical protein
MLPEHLFYTGDGGILFVGILILSLKHQVELKIPVSSMQIYGCEINVQPEGRLQRGASSRSYLR